MDCIELYISAILIPSTLKSRAAILAGLLFMEMFPETPLPSLNSLIDRPKQGKVTGGILGDLPDHDAAK